ncbi:methyl-accepting chemotaxis protein [Paenibacillus sp. sgz500958]|uniref:methyl-accepting chemotaxis protein n=1 Tax=Paenibacillus sp. sgz500958 TaxID=3242475 RepID=UPI0036D39393
MSRMEEIIWKRNKLIAGVFYVVLILGAVLAATISPKLWTTNAVTLLFCAWLTYGNMKKKFIKVIPWAATVVLAFVSIYLTLGKANTTVAILFCAVLLIYPLYRYFSAYFAAILIDFIAQLIMNPPAKETLVSDSLNLMLFGITGFVLFTVSLLNQRLLHEGEGRREQVEQSRQKVENMLERVKEASAGLYHFTEVLKKKVLDTGSITNEVILSFEEVAKGVDFQASSVSEISESLTVSDRHIQDVAQSSKEMKQLSSDTALITEKGSTQIEILNTQINELYEMMTTTSAEMQEFNRQNEAMSIILSSIMNISRQTNLLALNAAIEAARAGEQGRGFAVVSSEVRKLAVHSEKSTHEISEILSKLQTQSQTLTEQFHKAQISLEEGKSSVVVADEIFQSIHQNTNKVLVQAADIEHSSVSMQESSRRVVNEVTEISGVTQQSSAASEEILASMTEQRSITNIMVESFKELEQLIVALNDLVTESNQTPA